MQHSRFSKIGSLFTAFLFAGAILLSGCSDSLTGTTPADQDQVTVQQQAQHNQTPNSADTDPNAGHNTSDQD